jgi:integrase
MRKSEVVGLRWEWVKGDYIELPASISKNGHGRRIPLTKRALELMGVHDFAMAGTEGLVFRGQRGGMLHNLDRVLRTAAKRAKLTDLSFHCFRHEWASRFVKNGGDLRGLMDIGGWRKIEMVTRYAHADFEKARSVMEASS